MAMPKCLRAGTDVSKHQDGDPCGVKIHPHQIQKCFAGRDGATSLALA